MAEFCGFMSSVKYFNGREWVALKDYKPSDRVLQYNADGTGELVRPLEFGTYSDEEHMFQYPVPGSSGMLTMDHRLVFRKDKDCSVLNITRMSKLREGNRYFIPVTCEWELGKGGVDLSTIARDILISGEPLMVEFIEELYSLSLKDRLVYLSSIFSGNVYHSSSVEKLKLVADLLTFSNEAYWLTIRKGGCGGFVQWYSLGSLRSDVGYSALFVPEYRWRGISVKEYRMFDEVKQGTKQKYYITVPSGMIMLKFGIHNVVVGDSRNVFS